MPFRETAFQGYTFLSFVYVGMISAFLYDLALPALNSSAVLLHAAADILLCTATAVMSFIALAVTGCGTLRLYMGAAFLLGAFLYRAGIRRVFRAAINFFKKNRSLRRHSE